MSAIDVPKAFHVMAKPAGSACNLSCEYCFFRKKGRLYPGSNFRMSDEVHETYIRQLFETLPGSSGDRGLAGWRAILNGASFFSSFHKTPEGICKAGDFN
jgi:uncharacterized protein